MVMILIKCGNGSSQNNNNCFHETWAKICPSEFYNFKNQKEKNSSVPSEV